MASKSLGKGFRKVSHCIFDMDGLLLDTERLYTEATQKMFDQWGKTYTWEVKVTLMGLRHDEVAKRMVEIYDLPITWEEYSRQQHALQVELFANAKLLPGAERLVRHLHAKQVPFALATSSGEPMVDIKTSKHQELFSLFHHRVCGSTDPEVKEGKPAPDIFLIAAARWAENPAPADCLVFEDAPNGVTAANGAGMQVVMVPDERVPPEMCANATLVLKSLEDFKPEEFGLPAFES